MVNIIIYMIKNKGKLGMNHTILIIFVLNSNHINYNQFHSQIYFSSTLTKTRI